MNSTAKCSISQALAWADKELHRTSTSTHLDAEVLLSFVLKKDKAFLHTYPEKSLISTQRRVFTQFIAQRKKGVPVAYLTHHQEFYGHDFYVDPRVLIPRPETERLIDIAGEYIKKLPGTLTVADIGTGSGCIAISLKKLYPGVKMIASDNSLSSLKVAKKNATIHHVSINFSHGNLIIPLYHKKIDILVANLPYVPVEDKKRATINNRGLRFEPANALYAKDNGLALYKKLLNQIGQRAQKPSVLIFEHDPRHAVQLQKITRAAGYSVKQVKDLAKRNRYIVATRDLI